VGGSEGQREKEDGEVIDKERQKKRMGDG